MAKSSLEKQIAKAQKESESMARKQAREARKLEEKEARRQRATSIISGQPLIDGFRVMDETSEEVLLCLLECGEEKTQCQRNYTDDIFPPYIQYSIELELEKLIQYGMISIVVTWDAGGILNLLPPAFSYFKKKEEALQKKEMQEKQNSFGSIINYGNLVMGNAVNSTFSIDNSIRQIEKKIDEQAAEDREELLELLEEVKELIDNIQGSRSIPKQRNLFNKLSKHMSTHGWFYAEVVALLGQQAITMLGM